MNALKNLTRGSKPATYQRRVPSDGAAEHIRSSCRFADRVLFAESSENCPPSPASGVTKR
jgi:hypothetical protein